MKKSITFIQKNDNNRLGVPGPFYQTLLRPRQQYETYRKGLQPEDQKYGHDQKNHVTLQLEDFLDLPS